MTIQSLRPYADLAGFFKSVLYRSVPTMQFKELAIDEDRVHHVVRIDDLRTIPRHEFKLDINRDVLKPHYARHAPSLQLIVLTRDSMLRREVVLAKYGIDDIPEVISLRPDDLRVTGHRDRLPVEFVVVSAPVIRGSKALPRQKASRLAHLHVTLANASGGASFPYKRASADEIETRGLPAETAIHLELFCDYKELVKANDTAAHELFRVWINEKLWDALQNDRQAVSSHLRMLAVTETTATLLLSASLPAIKAGIGIEDGSVVGQLLAFVAKQTASDVDTLRNVLETSFAVSELTPFLQAAFRYTTISSRIGDDGGSE